MGFGPWIAACLVNIKAAEGSVGLIAGAVNGRCSCFMRVLEAQRTFWLRSATVSPSVTSLSNWCRPHRAALAIDKIDIGEQAMPMLVVVQILPDAADPDDMESRASRGIPLGEDGQGGLGPIIRSHTRYSAIEQKHRLFRIQARQRCLQILSGYDREVVVAVPSFRTRNVSPVEETEASRRNRQ